MTLRDRLQDDTTAAMRSGDALRRDTLRMVRNAIYNIEKAKKVTISEDDITGVVARVPWPARRARVLAGCRPQRY